MTNIRKIVGDTGEQSVVDYLRNKHYYILATNFRIHGGEVDIIAQYRDTISFVEVKTRNNPLVDPAEVITRAKQKKIMFAAQVFLAQHKKDINTTVCRFDVALVSLTHNAPHIRYIENAFQMDEQCMSL